MIQNTIDIFEDKKPSFVLTILASDAEEYGCPHCGFLYGNVFISTGLLWDWFCRDCGKKTIIVQDIVISESLVSGLQLVHHPRHGIKARESIEDQKPKDGEYFYSRGLGEDKSNGCFVCAGPENIYNNLSGFVICNESAQRIVKLFTAGAQVRLNKTDPVDVRVSIGACDNHLNNLRKLNDLISRKSVINSLLIRNSVFL